jgi:hypothetical protein
MPQSSDQMGIDSSTTSLDFLFPELLREVAPTAQRYEVDHTLSAQP